MPLFSCWHSAVLVLSIWSTGDSCCPCGGSRRKVLGGEIGQHSWGDLASSGEWDWFSLCTASSLLCKCLKNVFILMLALRRWTLQISAKPAIAIGAGGSVAWAVQWVVGEAEPDLTTGMILKSFILFGKIWFKGSLILYLNPYSIRHRESVRATQEKY